MSDDDFGTWLRRQVQARLALAQRAIELGNLAEWTEQSSGVLFYAEPTETDAWHGTWAMGDSSVTRLMEANDPPRHDRPVRSRASCPGRSQAVRVGTVVFHMRRRQPGRWPG